MSGTPLPEFSAPPLSEVAISVQFEPLQQLLVPQIGLLWQHYGDKYIHVEQHSPIDPVIERLGVRESLRPFPSIQLMPTPPLPRVWFLNANKKELLQIQQDRFVRNWRKVQNSDQYPRYDDYIRPAFVKDLDDFQKFLSDNSIGEVRSNQCEVTYINHIMSGDLWSDHADIGKVFTVCSPELTSQSICEVEDVTLQMRQILKDKDENFIGRLYVTIKPVLFGADDKPIFVLTLTARGRPLGDGTSGIMEFIDIGRECIVRSFASITRPEFHELWGVKSN